VVFRIRTIDSVKGAKLFVHTIPHGDNIGVEFHNNGATLTRERFEETIAWVRSELDTLDQHARQMKFVN
jgi:hypothetical protein